MRKIEGLKFLLVNFPNLTVDTVFIESEEDILSEKLKLDESKNQYWRVRSASKGNSELRLPMASIYEYEQLMEFIDEQRSKFSDIQFVIHLINDDYFYPNITGSLAVYNNEDIPKIVIELQQVTREMLDNMDVGKRPRDWGISVCFEYNFLHKYPQVTKYKDIDIASIKGAISKLYEVGLKMYELYDSLGINEASYTRFNIYDDGSIILNDHRSTESFFNKLR